MPPERLSSLAAKFDANYGIAHTKGQRVVNKRAGRANTLFVAYSPSDEYRVENERLPWMLLATPGEGVETERWQDVGDRPVWLAISCAGTMTPARCAGLGGGHQQK